MPFDEKRFNRDMGKKIDKLTEAQADIISKRIAAAFMAGWRLEEGGKLTTIQQRAIKKMSASTAGYIHEFNKAIGKQVSGKISELMAVEMLNKDIAKELITYVDEVFGKNGQVIIDHVGQTRQIIKVDQYGKLSKVDKVITRKYTSNPKAYSEMLAQTSTHNALEQGRAEGRIAKGKKYWRFAGPAAENSRPWHVALIGNVYEYGSDQSNYAMEILAEPRCRHRSIEWFDDVNLDTPQSHYQKLKDDAGLKWEKDKWTMPENIL